jgi:sulfur carrier protein
MASTAFMPAITVNGELRPLKTGQATIADLIREMRLEGKRIAVERNGEIVPRSRYAETPLVANDKLEIVGAVGGG